MGWGQDPTEARAAQVAAADPHNRIANRPLTPGERSIVEALDRIAAALEASRPAPLEPIVGYAAGFGVLLDFGPGDLDLVTDTAATALENTHPDLAREGYSRTQIEAMAETVVVAALRQAAELAADMDSGGQEAAAGEEVTGAYPGPPVTDSNT